MITYLKQARTTKYPCLLPGPPLHADHRNAIPLWVAKTERGGAKPATIGMDDTAIPPYCNHFETGMTVNPPHREARERHPNLWSGDIRDWVLPVQVWLNPENEQPELNKAA